MPDIQKLIDALFIKNPQLREYIEWAMYVPPGVKLPEDTTHTLTLANPAGDDLIVALKVDGIYSVVVDLLLKVL